MYDYNCPDCNEAKLQSEKNARKINEVIEQVNQIVDNDIATTEVLGELNTEVDNIKSSLDNITNIGETDILKGKYKNTSLEGILLEIYNRLKNYTNNDSGNDSGNDSDYDVKETIGEQIPTIYFSGDTSSMTKENHVDLEMRYVSNNYTWNGFANVKWQGSSSIAFPKKNYTIKLYNNSEKTTKSKFNMNGWGSQNKFCLKANYIDHSHARNIVSARIWSEIVSSRSDYENLPNEYKTSPNHGAIDGFPIKVFINDTYQGIYTWNIPKDGWMFNMSEGNINHAVLCDEFNYNSTTTPCNFRGVAKCDGSDWSLEYPDTLNDNILTSFNNLISHILYDDDLTFRNGISQYLNINSAIDYYIYAYYGGFCDSLSKNLIMATYNGTEWLCCMYDMDSTWGLYIDGSKLNSYNMECPEGYMETKNLLWERIEKCFSDRLYDRYIELRGSVLNKENVINKFTSFMEIIGDSLYADDFTVYPGIPKPCNSHLQQITEFVTSRETFVDLAFEEFKPSNSDLVSLSVDDFSIRQGYTKKIKVNYVPSDCQDKDITYSINNNNCSITNSGFLTSNNLGETVLTVRGVNANVTDSCNVYITNEDDEPFKNIAFEQGYIYDYLNGSKVNITNGYSTFILPITGQKGFIINDTSGRVILFDNKKEFVKGNQKFVVCNSTTEYFAFCNEGSQTLNIGEGFNNLIETSTIKNNGSYYNPLNGEVKTDSGFNSIYTECVENTSLLLGDGVTSGAFFDSSNNYISTIEYNTSSRSITSPSNCAYVGLNYTSTSESPKAILIEKYYIINF